MHISNLVGNEGISKVKQELERLGVSYKKVTDYKVIFDERLESGQANLIMKRLSGEGFDIYLNKKELICELICGVVDEIVAENSGLSRFTFSEVLRQKLGYDYAYLSATFSNVKGITIKKYLMLQRLERVKTLIKQDDLSLKEISYRLQYSSVAHLSAQFKRITGNTPSNYRSHVRGE